MARRKSSSDDFSNMSWWAALLIGIIGGACIYALGLLAENFVVKGTSASASSQAQLVHLLTPIASLFFVFIFLVVAISSLAADSKRDRLLRQTVALNQIKALPQDDFERLIGEIFRRLGYQVSKVNSTRVKTGVDFTLRKPGELILLRCKSRDRNNIGVALVREMAGLIAHHNATAAVVITTTSFTADAQHFAAGKPIQLINGAQLLQLVARANGNTQ